MAKNNNGGRPTGFNEEIAQRIINLAAEGKFEYEIANKIGVTRATLWNWKKKHEGLFDALERAKEFADGEIEAALYSRAKGYSHPAIKMFYDKESASVITHEYTEHYPPDTQAAVFWLKNRRPKRWRDLQKVEQKTEHAGTVTYGIIRSPDGEIQRVLKTEIKK